MSIYSPLKTCVFSAVKARLTKNGKPLIGATVIRRWEWRDLQEESTKTDTQGWFTYSAKFENSVTRLLPLELVIAQALYVVVDGVETKFWSNSKREPQENTEFNGNSIYLLCEMNNPNKSTKEFGAIILRLEAHKIWSIV